MKKFIAIYHSSDAAKEYTAKMTPEQREKGMKTWFAWNENCGSAIVDLGAPLMAGQKLNDKGGWNAIDTSVSGYSIIQGKDLEAVQALFVNHPHLSWAPGTSIEIHEFAPM